MFPTTLILRHRKENLKKCSLRGLERRSDFVFLTYPAPALPSLSHYFLLSINAPVLSAGDASHGIFLLDATWRYAQKMEKTLPEIPRRSLPAEFKTAYPRKQEDCPDPQRGLASLEALFISYILLGREPNGLLENYFWKEKFLELNRAGLERYSAISLTTYFSYTL